MHFSWPFSTLLHTVLQIPLFTNSRKNGLKITKKFLKCFFLASLRLILTYLKVLLINFWVQTQTFFKLKLLSLNSIFRVQTQSFEFKLIFLSMNSNFWVRTQSFEFEFGFLSLSLKIWVWTQKFEFELRNLSLRKVLSLSLHSGTGPIALITLSFPNLLIVSLYPLVTIDYCSPFS